jgi:hypothetical protein
MFTSLSLHSRRVREYLYAVTCVPIVGGRLASLQLLLFCSFQPLTPPLDQLFGSASGRFKLQFYGFCPGRPPVRDSAGLGRLLRKAPVHPTVRAADGERGVSESRRGACERVRLVSGAAESA